MGLPKIASYTLPRHSELPASKPAWTLTKHRTALLIHDMQRYFVNAFPAEAPPLPDAIANIARLRECCDANGIPVFYTAQQGDQLRADRGLQADFWGPGMSSDPSDRDIVAALAPRPRDIVLEKWRYSAFKRTNLEHLLRARGRDQLIVTGVFAHIGCLLTAADAFMHDVEPFFVADGVAAYSREQHDAALTYAAGCCAIVADTATVLATLTSGEREST